MNVNVYVGRKVFVFIILTLSLVAYFISPYANYAMWFGFAVAGYSVIANDSIQTLGTFLSCNRQKSWWFLFTFTGGILSVFLIAGWYLHHHDIAFGRLYTIPQPTHFSTITLLAPVALVVLTRFRFPVSTSFLVLSIFSSQLIIQKMLIKSVSGYVVAFIVAFFIWHFVNKIKYFESNKDYSKRTWWVLQLFATGFLWVSWMMHDIANVAVFLPRKLPLPMMIVVVGYLVFIIAALMLKRGGKIQDVVNEKTNTNDMRIATIIDFSYALVLVLFKELSSIPMSTTWVFLGILGGRELAISFYRNTISQGRVHALTLIRRDIFRAVTGLTVSLVIIVFVVNF